MGFTSDDRAIIETYFALHMFDQAMNQIEHHGAWSARLSDLRLSLTAIADEIDEYLESLSDMEDNEE